MGKPLSVRLADLIQDAANAIGLDIRTAYPEWAALDKIEAPDTIVDVGVAYGTPLLYRKFPDARLVMIEPVPLFYPHLENNILKQRNGLLIKAAAGASTGRATLNIEDTEPLKSSMFTRSDATHHDGAKKQIEIEVRTLDDILEGIPLGPNALLKIDTEGNELAVINGAQNTLNRFRYIISEVSAMKRFEGSYAPAELITALAKKGFDIRHVLAAPVDKYGIIRVLDILFERR